MRLYLIGILLFVSLQGCRKEVPEDNIECRMQDGEFEGTKRFNIHYDKYGRISYYTDYTESDTTHFDYSDKEVRLYHEGKLRWLYRLNSKGAAETRISYPNWYQNYDSVRYEYDADSYLTKFYYNKNLPKDHYLHVVENGVRKMTLKYEFYGYHGQKVDSIFYEYYNEPDPYYGRGPVTFMGKHYSRLLYRTKHSFSYMPTRFTIEYTYEKNKAGMIIKEMGKYTHADGASGSSSTAHTTYWCDEWMR